VSPSAQNLVAEIHHLCLKTTSQKHEHRIATSQLSDIAGIICASQIERLALAVLLNTVDLQVCDQNGME
jgi:hypothetical protein